MATINPFSVDDCRALLASHADQIARGEYDLSIASAWVDQLDASELQLLAVHCPSSRSILAEHAKDPDVLRRLVKSGDHDVQSKIAQNSNTPFDVLDSLARSTSASIRCHVASNPNTNSDVLGILAHDNVMHVREAVAGNPRTPHDFLHILARDTSPTVPIALSRNRHIPLSFFEALIAAGSDRLRWLIAANTNRTDVLDLLAHDSSAETRACVSENSAVASDTRKRLLKDKDVRRVLAEQRQKHSNSGCFIATVCFGSAAAPEVITFRSYRDNVLQQCVAGKLFIAIYYTVSPSIAKCLGNHPSAAALIRKVFLKPLARVISTRACQEEAASRHCGSRTHPHHSCD
jgi:hypothetical protein